MRTYKLRMLKIRDVDTDAIKLDESFGENVIFTFVNFLSFCCLGNIIF